MANSNEQLCWSCKNATGGCSWSRSFIPVDGWGATPTNLGEGIKSFRIKTCPQYKEDDVKLISYGELANILHININTLMRMKLNKLKKLVNKQGFELYFFFDEDEDTKIGIKKAPHFKI